MAEKIFTVPLRKDWLKVPKYQRSRKTKDSLKAYLVKHLKKDVRIGKYLNSEIWARGNKNPPASVKIRIDEDKDKLTAELINAPKEVKEEKKKGTIEKLKEKITGEKKEEIKKVSEELKEELKKEDKEEEKFKKPEKEAPKEKETAGEREKIIPKKGRDDVKK